MCTTAVKLEAALTDVKAVRKDIVECIIPPNNGLAALECIVRQLPCEAEVRNLWCHVNTRSSQRIAEDLLHLTAATFGFLADSSLCPDIIAALDGVLTDELSDHRQRVRKAWLKCLHKFTQSSETEESDVGPSGLTQKLMADLLPTSLFEACKESVPFFVAQTTAKHLHEFLTQCGVPRAGKVSTDLTMSLAKRQYAERWAETTRKANEDFAKGKSANSGPETFQPEPGTEKDCRENVVEIGDNVFVRNPLKGVVELRTPSKTKPDAELFGTASDRTVRGTALVVNAVRWLLHDWFGPTQQGSSEWRRQWKHLGSGTGSILSLPLRLLEVNSPTTKRLAFALTADVARFSLPKDIHELRRPIIECMYSTYPILDDLRPMYEGYCNCFSDLLCIMWRFEGALKRSGRFASQDVDTGLVLNGVTFLIDQAMIYHSSDVIIARQLMRCLLPFIEYSTEIEICFILNDLWTLCLAVVESPDPKVATEGLEFAAKLIDKTPRRIGRCLTDLLWRLVLVVVRFWKSESCDSVWCAVKDIVFKLKTGRMDDMKLLIEGLKTTACIEKLSPSRKDALRFAADFFTIQIS